MDYKELMAKLTKGEPLTKEEVADFEKEFRPTYRFNEVTQKKNELEAQLKTLTAENETLKTAATEAEQKVQDKVNLQLSELAGRVETLTEENNSLKSAKAETDTLLKFTTLATKNELGVIFKNPDYLAYRAGKAGIDTNDPEKLNAFLSELKEKEPELCLVAAKSGAGTGGQPPAHQEMETKPIREWDTAAKVNFIKEHGQTEYLNRVAAEEGAPAKE